MRSGILLLLFLVSINLFSQTKIKPGFDPQEYIELLSLSYYDLSNPDSIIRKNIKNRYSLIYKSQEIGLLNRWRLFLRQDNVAVIEIRGTVDKSASWLANFYAAMIPAKGSLQINDSTVFNYHFADNPMAMVHTGWTISTAYLAPEIIQTVNDLYIEKKITDFLIIGHSQGGAISFLVRSYLEYMQKENKIPAEIHFKTYSSAAPKPGNLYFAYEYENMNHGGWAFTVVNAADWVPETPISIQTITDFNLTNPFTDIKPALKKQKFLKRLAGNYVYNKLNRSTRKAEKRMSKYLGPVMYKQVKKYLPQLQEPEYAKGSNYMRAGSPIVLIPDKEYYENFPDGGKNKFIHHSFKPYYFLLKKAYLK